MTRRCATTGEIEYFVYDTQTLYFVFTYLREAAAIKRVAKLNAERGVGAFAYATHADWKILVDKVA